MPLKILMTTLELYTYTGLSLYTRDMALALKRLGHFPEVYTLKMGRVADELREAGIAVTDNLSQIGIRPDIIHGQHRVSTLLAVKQFRWTPAMFICHNHTFWGDEAPLHPRIIQYFGVSHVCMNRLHADGIPENRIHFLGNFVDTNRFLARNALPSTPKKALVFSNYASEETQLPAIREACQRAGLDLDVIGMQVNYSTHPETELGEYDIVFAKAKAAIEAMAVGNAVILCDFSGVGPMVNTAEFHELRLMNFGFQALKLPLEPEHLLEQINRYDSEEARKVRDLIRSTSSLEEAAAHMVAIYEQVIEEYRIGKPGRITSPKKLSLRESLYWERARFWASLTPAQENFFNSFFKDDPAAQEKIYIHARNQVPTKPGFSERLAVILNGYIQTITFEMKKVLRFLPVKIWMLIPENLRMQIKKATIFETASKKIKQILGLE